MIGFLVFKPSIDQTFQCLPLSLADQVNVMGPDYIVDIDGLPTAVRGAELDRVRAARRRSWLAVLWRCCGVYSRVYRNSYGKAYEGGCPRCGRLVRVRIGPDGTHSRFFEAH